jgi:hypothetical protein
VTNLDAASAKILKASRDRLIIALADAHQNHQSRADFRKEAEAIIDHYNSETREICVKVTNHRTKETQNQRIDIPGVVPRSGNVDQLMRWGAWLYAKGWDTAEFTSTVKVTKAEHPGPFYHVMMGKPGKKPT